MTYHFKVHRERDGYWAECLELKGCASEGDTREELERSVREALNLYLDEPANAKVAFPLPKRASGAGVMSVPVDPGVALSVLLRNYRLRHRYTQTQIARKLGMKNLYSYQRLERRSNPSLRTLQKLKRVFPDLSVDYVLNP